jgi:hypothetical protein
MSKEPTSPEYVRRSSVSAWLEDMKNRRLTETEWRWLKRNIRKTVSPKAQAVSILNRRKKGRRRKRRNW